MKVLVVGSGGREHALVWKLAQSPRVTKIYCAPGNGGIASLAQCAPISPGDIPGLIRFVREEGIDLTVVGPEDPLLQGIVDQFEREGLAIYGPTRAAALIEGSKSYAKGLMAKYGIPTAEYAEFTDYDGAWEYVREKGVPIVIKADGLAAGKGVVVARDLETAERALREMMKEGIFGEAGSKVVIEEYLEGEEMTLLSFVDGETVLPMQPAQDHKPVFEGDRGPNTGGMGCISPVPQIPSEMVDLAVERIVRPVAKALVAEGRPFRGVLYAGLMITADGPKVIEFNARFGDPEAQVILPRLKTDLVEIIQHTLDGRLKELELEWTQEAAVTVILASPGYPGSYPKNLPISGLEQVPEDILVFHAGTRRDEEGVNRTSGGRVLAVTGMGTTLAEAKEKAYEGVGKISFEGMHFRRDIGFRAERKNHAGTSMQ